jgi:hypothetical protein
VERGAGDGATLTLVDREHRRVIEVDPSDYPVVRFEGSWELASQLVRQSTLDGMRPIESRVEGRLLERRDGGRFVRVVWSDALALPLEVHAGSDDGHADDRLTVAVARLRRTDLPWLGIEDFEKKSMVDFQD